MNGAGVEVFVSAGSNIEPERNLRVACRKLADRFGPLRLSPVYRTTAVGFDGDDFLNLVLSFRSTASAAEVKVELERIEHAAGRVRRQDPFGPRTLDLDLLLYGDAVIPSDGIRVPRSDILKYAFVLRPLADIAAERVHPLTGRTIGAHWAEFDCGEQRLERWPGSLV